jgi:Tfp pilus assembly protein PilW
MKYLLIAIIVVLAAASFWADFRWKKWMSQQQAARQQDEAPDEHEPK